MPDKVGIVATVTMTRQKYKCQYIPLVRLASLLSKLDEGEGIEVIVDTEKFNVKSVEALAKAYQAKVKKKSSEGPMVTLLVYR